MIRFNNAFLALVVGVAFGLLTWVMIGGKIHPAPTGLGFEYVGEAIMIVLLPGIFAGAMVSGNIHLFDVWVVAIANTVFYFGVVYLALTRLAKRRAKRHDAMTAISNDGSSEEPN